MKIFRFLILAFVVACTSYSNNAEQTDSFSLKEGHWLFKLDLGEEELPFNVFFSNHGEEPLFIVKNGDEVIKSSEITFKRDSLHIIIPVFGSSIHAKIENDSTLNGFWINTTKSSDYQIPFTAQFGIEERFESSNQTTYSSFAGRWDVLFSPEEERPCKAVGIFEQDGNRVKGTFLTETGDYRFLEGIVDGENLSLSCFDGAHAFLFKAKMTPEREIVGTFWSGNHWQEGWTGISNPNAQLTHPDSITTIVNANPDLDLTFMGMDGKELNLNDERFKNKVLIIQIMGTWCPNCADESRDFVKLYDRYKDKGLEIVAVAYETSADFEKSKDRILSYIDEIGANYTFVYAGKANKKKNSEDFVMIDGITSYPTAIILDRNQRIRKVHTGYYGPGTGSYHAKFLEQTEMFIQKLLEEKEVVSS